jgi:dihydroflavonol-4-reductase
VLVTGASGFVGGWVARELARAGCRVRAFARRRVDLPVDGPHVEWVRGDLLDRDALARAVEGVRGVVHCGGWVSLRPDRTGLARRVNVDAVGALLDFSERAGVERFVYTSTLWTMATGSPDAPADESAEWNLEIVQGPYCATKREAERMVLDRNGPAFRTNALCPGLVVGAGDRTPTSTGLLLTMARWPFVILGPGGIPLVDAAVLALAHRRALERGEPGRRYAVVGPYVSYLDLARLVARVAGRPYLQVLLPGLLGPWLRSAAARLEPVLVGPLGELSGAGIGGGFLPLHVDGRAADQRFGLVHPDPLLSIYAAFDDHRQRGRAPWLATLRRPAAAPAAG